MSDLIFSFHLDISVGQIHAIFKLPLKFQSYKGMLAYIKWFTPLHSFLKDFGMYQIQQSTHMGCPEASIIPIEQIIQMCHLQPKFGSHIPVDWTSENALLHADTYVVNPDLQIHDFLLFHRYNQWLWLKLSSFVCVEHF